MVIVLRGAPSVGKSTIARALASAHPGWAAIESDFVVPCISEESKSLLVASGDWDRLWVDSVVALVGVLAGHGLDVALEGCFPAAAGFDLLVESLRVAGHEVKVGVLVASEVERLRRDASRPRSWRIGAEGVRFFSAHPEVARFGSGQVLDVSELSPEEAAERVLAELGVAR